MLQKYRQTAELSDFISRSFRVHHSEFGVKFALSPFSSLVFLTTCNLIDISPPIYVGSRLFNLNAYFAVFLRKGISKKITIT